jgi:HD superfamily phosphodiesterase
LPEPDLSIIKRHVGGGITATEASKLGWAKDVYVPKTVEEKIVSYADKLVEGSHRVPIERTLEVFAQDLPPSAVERVRRLHEEMLGLIGDCEWLQ